MRGSSISSAATPGQTGVRGDVTDAIAAGLDRMHLHLGKVGQNVGCVLKPDPVVLDVLARREMAVAAIVLVRDVGKCMHLAAVERAVRDGDAQHIGVELKIEPVHQPERQERLLAQRARKAAADLIPELRRPLPYQRPVVAVIPVHDSLLLYWFYL